jgi:hypothetical protein
MLAQTAPHTLLALLIYGSWTLLLVASIAALRWHAIRYKGFRVNQFKVTGEDVSAFSARLCRAPRQLLREPGRLHRHRRRGAAVGPGRRY